MNIKVKLIDCLSTLSKVPTNEFNDDTEIYSSGILSSLKLLELMSSIEREYKIIVKPEELIEENFKNVEVLTSFIESKIHQN